MKKSEILKFFDMCTAIELVAIRIFLFIVFICELKKLFHFFMGH